MSPMTPVLTEWIMAPLSWTWVRRYYPWQLDWRDLSVLSEKFLSFLQGMLRCWGGNSLGVRCTLHSECVLYCWKLNCNSQRARGRASKALSLSISLSLSLWVSRSIQGEFWCWKEQNVPAVLQCGLFPHSLRYICINKSIWCRPTVW